MQSFDFNRREWSGFKDVEMAVFRNDVFCIGNNGTINELVVIRVGSDEVKLIMCINSNDIAGPQNGFYGNVCS